MLETAIFFRGFPVLMVSSLRQVLQTYSEIYLFCGAIQYIVPKNSLWELHMKAEPLETVFDEAHFKVNFHNFFQKIQKTIKNRQALHEIIRALSLSIIFVEFSFKPVYLTMVVKIFKFMKN